MLSRTSEKQTACWLLVAYRSFSILAAAGQIFFFPHFTLSDNSLWILLGVAATYTVFKIINPLRRYNNRSLTYADFTFDVILSGCLLLLTGGIYSPFLLYSLSPILTSALFFPPKLTYSILIVPFLCLVIRHFLVPEMSIVLPEVIMGLLISFAAAVFLMARLPYTMNINASQVIKTQAVVSERKRLSREMHDGVAQSLGLVHLKIEQLQQLLAEHHATQALSQVAQIKGLIDEVQEEIGEVVNQSNMSTGLVQGFIPSLAQHTLEFTKTYGIVCRLDIPDDLALPFPVQRELLCIVSEALSNAGKHAAADTVEVTLERAGGAIRMAIVDNGRGFDVDAVFHGSGLAVMKERAGSLGGEVNIVSSANRGTRIEVSLPVPTIKLPVAIS